MKRPKMRITRSDRGKKITFDPGFWDMQQLNIPVVQSAPVTYSTPVQSTPTVEPIIEQTLPEVTVQGSRPRISSFALPSLKEMFGPQSLKEYIRDYFTDILGIPKLPGPGQLGRFKYGKLPCFEDGNDVYLGTADATYHKDWYSKRSQQFDNNNRLINGNDDINRQLNDLSNTKEYDSWNMPDMTSGRHFDNEIHYNRGRVNQTIRDHTGESDEDIKVHERTHALNPMAQEAAVDNILNEWNGDPNNKPIGRQNYYGNEKEIYAFLMQNRHSLGLDPSYKVSSDDIRNWRNSKKIVGGLSTLPDQVLLRLFNEVAYNSTPRLNIPNMV